MLKDSARTSDVHARHTLVLIALSAFLGFLGAQACTADSIEGSTYGSSGKTEDADQSEGVLAQDVLVAMGAKSEDYQAVPDHELTHVGPSSAIAFRSDETGAHLEYRRKVGMGPNGTTLEFRIGDQPGFVFFSPSSAEGVRRAFLDEQFDWGSYDSKDEFYVAIAAMANGLWLEFLEDATTVDPGEVTATRDDLRLALSLPDVSNGEHTLAHLFGRDAEAVGSARNIVDWLWEERSHLDQIEARWCSLWGKQKEADGCVKANLIWYIDFLTEMGAAVSPGDN